MCVCPPPASPRATPLMYAYMLQVGWASDAIDRLEAAGYVMSGSRHKKMNAVRLRKENQVYSAEEKRALALFNYEEKAARETRLMAEFKEMLEKRAAAASAAPTAPGSVPPAVAAVNAPGVAAASPQ